MAKAIDIGTSFIVGAEIKDGREVFTRERNAFFSMEAEDFAEEMLNDAGAYYLTRGKQLIVVGEDALKFSMLTGNQKSYRRPMAGGILNPGEEEAISMLEILIEGIVGKASFPGEICAATCPCTPFDEEGDVTFHKIVIERCLKRLGYQPKLLNEAMAIIFHENPEIDADGLTVPFSGLGISFGAGMTNAVVAWRAKRLFETSVARGGDWIDHMVGKARGMKKSKVTSEKERKLNLAKISRKNGLHMALEIYHEELIRYALQNICEAWKEGSASIEEALPICVAGGTASVPGFEEVFVRVLEEIEPPFEVADVSFASDPLTAVASGALVAAISAEKKKSSGAASGAVAKLKDDDDDDDDDDEAAPPKSGRRRRATK
ncbi:MAG: disk-shape morphogenesis protein volactin [Planctomycetota bacterium]|jgi:hypothetical protein